MARAVAARLQGDDYQIRFFWIQACRLFEERTKVTSVELESEDAKSIDDVVVRYENYLDLGEPVRADFYQVKFHVTGNGAFTWRSMMDPSFVNAKSVSILQRLLDAQRKYAPAGKGCRFLIFSPWAVHPDDELSTFVSLSDGHLRWDILGQGGQRSKTGKVREAWKRHLGLKDDEDLRRVVNVTRLFLGPALSILGEQMNLHLRIAGLVPVAETAAANPYDDLGRKFIERGERVFNRETLENICRGEGLWVGRATQEPGATRIGIRSFWKFAEHLEDETDACLCLLRHFDGRLPRTAAVWDSAIAPEVKAFLNENVKPGRSYHIRLQTHGTVAFLAGWELHPKSGVDVTPVQDSIRGRELWKDVPNPSGAGAQYTKWKLHTVELGPSDRSGVVLAISTTHDIERDVLSFSRKELPDARCLIHCFLPNAGPTSVADGRHAALLAESLVAILRTHAQDSGWPGRTHVFFATPNGLIFMFGRLAHGLGPLTLYEFDFEGSKTYGTSLNLSKGESATIQKRVGG